MTRALVLNATYEPISVVTGTRAAVLVLSERAVTVHGSGRVLRSERLSLEEPSVVRLCRYVKVPQFRSRRFSRRAVLARDDFRCQYCGVEADGVDHVVPRSRGGGHGWDNVVAACHRCNSHKRDRLLDETSLRLRRAPVAPALSTWFSVMAGRNVPACWEPYLGVDQQSA